MYPFDMKYDITQDVKGSLMLVASALVSYGAPAAESFERPEPPLALAMDSWERCHEQATNHAD